MSNQTIFEIQAELCRAMGNPQQMKIMHLLRDGPMSVNNIASVTNQPQGTISRNLGVLRNAGIVMSHREGHNVHYRVANPKLTNVCDLMYEALTEQISERSKLMEYREE